MNNLLQKLLNSYRVSGREFEIREVIVEELKNIGCDFHEDLLGNIVVRRGNGQERLMLSANMDTSGFIVTYIDDKGFVRVNSVGDINLKNIVGSLVKFEGGLIGRVSSNKENPSINDIYIDMGVNKKEELRDDVKEGDTAVLLSSGFASEKNIINYGLDNAVGCYMLLKLIREVAEFNKEIIFVFAAQGILGGRGARAAAYEAKPQKAVVLSSEESGDYIGAKGKIKLGNGPVLRIKDKSLIICQNVKKMIEEGAENAEVNLQYSVSSELSEGMIHKEIEGISTGVLALPIRYKGTAREMMNKSDIKNTMELIKKLL